jgi:tetratricopeptide (TPR) repeat protein
MRMRSLFVAGLLTVAGAAAAPGMGQTAVTVIGGGLAQACSQAVRTGRADRPLLELCTASLEQEALRRRDRAGTFVNRGVVQLRMRAFDDALRDFERAERLNPVLGEVYVNRGAALISKASYREALTEIDRGIALGVEDPEKAYYNRALAHEGLDDMKSAYLDYRKAAELNPEWTLPATQLTRFTVTRR